MKTTRFFHLKVFSFSGKILNIFEYVCFRNAIQCLYVIAEVLGYFEHPCQRQGVSVIPR